MAEFTPPLPARRRDGGVQPRLGKQREDFVTLAPGVETVFLAWRVGARMPQGFHRTEAEAVAYAGKRCPPGVRIAIFKAEITGLIEVPAPVITYRNGRIAP